MTGNENALAAAETAARSKSETGTIDNSFHHYSTKRKPVCQSEKAWADYCLRWEILRMTQMLRVMEWEP